VRHVPDGKLGFVALIERVGRSEWQRWRELRLQALRDSPDAFGSNLEREAGFSESDWFDRIGAGPSWIAVVDGEDVGIISGGEHHGSEVPWVYAAWVDPRVRGSDVAAELVAAVVEWARSTGAMRLGLDVADRAPRARRFYERLGFVTGERSFPMPRDPTIVLVEMYLDLTAPAPTAI
jgi:GNAT superfamily N-acetyltransferase